jgi:virginiamycin B lyase
MNIGFCPMAGRIRLWGLLAAVGLLTMLSVPQANAALYWGSGGGVGAANADGSMLIRDYPYGVANMPPEGSVVAAAVNGTHLFWGDLTNNAIGSMALSGTPDGRVLFSEPRVSINEALVPSVERPWGVAVDASHLYWASTDGAIGRANLDGSAADRNFIGGLQAPCGLALDDEYVYWGNIEAGSIGRARLDGTEVEPGFITGVEAFCGVAVDVSHLYWTTEGAIGRASIDGSDPDPAFIPSAGRPCGIAVDAAHIYWANFIEPGTFVSRANLDGGGAAPLVGEPSYAAMCGVALDSRVFEPRPFVTPASLPIRFGPIKRRRGGRLLVLPVNVPERGELTLTSPPRIGWRLEKGPPPPPWRGGSFRWNIKLWPGKGRVGERILRQLQNHQRAPVSLRFNWEQQGHTPVTTSKHIAFAPQPRSLHGR